MKSVGKFSDLLAKRRKLGFTLIELLVVITIIGILMALVIGVAGPVQQQARVYRARGEVAGFETALTRFETDNGFIPVATNIPTKASDTYYSGEISASAAYEQSARALFLAITGRNFFLATDNMGVNYFTSLKGGQTSYNPSDYSVSNSTNRAAASYDTYITAGNFDSNTKGDYLRDPWGAPYGYYCSTNSTNRSIYNQVTYDLWSTSDADDPTSATDSAIKKWSANWPNQ